MMWRGNRKVSNSTRVSLALWFFTGVAAALGLGPVAALAEEPIHGNTSYQNSASFSDAIGNLTGLEGCWRGKDRSGISVEISFELDHDRTVLMERFRLEGELPRFTLYDITAERLIAHYFCESDNQIRLLAEPSSDTNILNFEFLDAIGPPFDVQEHISHVRFTFRDLDHFAVELGLRRNGKSESQSFLLRRVFEGCEVRERSDDW